jgi:hypothetical protein
LLGSNRHAESQKESLAEEGAATRDAKIVVLRNTESDAPNITLNVHDRVGRTDLRIVAAIGTVLQIGVLLYSGFATYHPGLMFKKGSPVSDYAFPCVAAGTLFLVAGMLICAHVVESSTKEKRYHVKPGWDARIVWLQKAGTVNDQTFESFALFADSPRKQIIISQRARKKDPNGRGETPAKGEAKGEEKSLVSELQTIVGTGTALLGFVVQFIGLRGMHWSASIAQLGAVLLMTALRAWVRRGLANPPKSQPLLPGYELDWLAMTLGGNLSIMRHG